MDEKQKETVEQTDDAQHIDNPSASTVKRAGQFMQIKPFTLIMLMFLTILLTAGMTIFALTFGEKKVVEVKVPVERAEFKMLYEAYDELKNNYYTDIDERKIILGAIDGMFQALDDPYSDYMSNEESQSFHQGLSSSFQGIGAEIQERAGFITVVSPIKNSPAEKAGVLPGDKILSVDGESLQGKTANEAVMMIRGEKGTRVKLSIQRGNAEKVIDLTIIRDDIPLETVYGDMKEDKIAHIRITSFSENTYEELLTILDEFDGQGMKAIVLDVRQNPGGYLEEAELMASLFIEEGKPVVQVQTKDSKPEVSTAKGGPKFKQPVTVLIDNGSASASEVLAGALRESANVKLVGLTTFGKGTVQTIDELKDGSTVKFTTAKWLTPNGNWVNEDGLQPDVKVNYATYASLPFLDTSASYKKGMVSEEIKTAEQMLKVLGYDPGQVDGQFDHQTAAAIKSLQTANKLEKTGVLTGETTYALMDALRLKIEKDDPQLLKAKQLLQQQIAK